MIYPRHLCALLAFVFALAPCVEAQAGLLDRWRACRQARVEARQAARACYHATYHSAYGRYSSSPAAPASRGSGGGQYSSRVYAPAYSSSYSTSYNSSGGMLQSPAPSYNRAATQAPASESAPCDDPEQCPPRQSASEANTDRVVVMAPNDSPESMVVMAPDDSPPTVLAMR